MNNIDSEKNQQVLVGKESVQFSRNVAHCEKIKNVKKC